MLAGSARAQYTFQRLKMTAPSSCTILSPGGSCWEPSEQYKWKDMVSAATKMMRAGVGGGKLYAGPDGYSDAHKFGAANIAAFLAQVAFGE